MQLNSKTDNCQLCGSNNPSLIHKTIYKNIPETKHYICNTCGFIYVLPRLELPTINKENPLLDDEYFKKKEQIAKAKFQTLESELGDYLWSQTEQRSLLEIGCETGSLLRLMRACGWKVLGIEPQLGYARSGEERYRVSIKNQSLEDFEVTEKFDLICSFDRLEKIENLNSFFKNIHQLLRDRGYLYIENICLDRWYERPYAPLFHQRRINTFSQKTLLAFLAKNGFNSTALGWNKDRFWVIATKAELESLNPIWDNAKRLQNIVEQANFKQSKKQTQRGILLPLYRTIELLKTEPANIPQRIQKKLERYLNFFSSEESDPSNAEKVAIKPANSQPSQLKIAHVGLHGNFSNGGDTLLFPTVRWLFQKHLAPIDFSLVGLREKVTQETIDEINRQDALLIGGGGLLIADSNPNNLSGWQWACPPELLEQIKVPIIVFAIGYNRFRGQSEFAPIFAKSVRQLVEKSSFLGLRNYGSIAAIKNYLPEELHAKLSFQPCPTTILNRFYPNIFITKATEQIISMNIAFDRHHLRFGGREDEILWTIADVLKTVQKEGWKPVVLNHCAEDKDFALWYKARGLEVEEIDLFYTSPRSVIEAYSNVSLALGMRGHSQMVPFGLGCPIISLISHDKLGFFLDDINHPEWGVDVKAQDFKEQLLEKIHFVKNDSELIKKQVIQSQDELWKTTENNLDIINKILFK